MKISGTATIPGAAPSAFTNSCKTRQFWRNACLAAIRLVKTGENEYEMRMKLLIASLSGLFDGKVRLSDHEPPRRSGWRSRAKARSAL